MSDPEKTTQPDTTDAEAQALAAAEVGYRRTTARADYEAPAEESAQQVDTESGPTEPANEAPETNPEPDLSAQQPTPEQAIADQLAALKSQVQELKASSDNNPTALSAEDHFASVANVHEIEEEIQNLPARQREAFLLRYWEDLDVAETATAMGCSEGSVKTHCSRAIQALHKALTAKGLQP